MALAFARAGRGAITPVFLLTDEKVLQVVVGLGVSRRSSCRRGAPRPGLMALAFARAGRGAITPVFLLTDEKVLQVVVGLGVSRRSSCSSGCCWGRTVQHTSGLNHHHSPPARPQSTVRPAPVRGGRPRRGTVPRRVCGACSCVRGKASSADAPVLLTDEKVLGVVAGLVVSRRSSSRSGCCWGRIVEHISGLNYCCGLPAWSESLVWPAPVRGGRVDGGIGGGERRVWPAPV